MSRTTNRIVKAAAARKVGVAPPTIQRWIDRGLLAGWRVGGRVYVDSDEVDRVAAGERMPITS
ncbi:helix-turn-helix domain-containing protein [Tsukamurella pseudospumae]|uniref:helix-turn-helix domain-containing protein n=1 Tax=Tsukamurella pseudospumae TaxID=239498 RepID=UPI0009E67F35